MKSFVTLVLLALPVLAADHKPVPFGTLSATPPAEWTSVKPKYTLRSHQYTLKATAEGVEDAELIVTPQSKPDPEKVFPGLRLQFTPPEGKKSEENGKVSKFEAGAATVHLLDLAGTWKYKERPFDKSSPVVEKTEFRVIWAIIVVKDEATHVRLSGPQKVVDGYYEGFEKWLKAIK